jgi:MFS family permease
MLRTSAANAIMNLGNGAAWSVMILLVIGPLGLPRSSFGLLLTMLAAGGLVGAAVADPLARRVGIKRTLIGAPLVTSAGYLVVAGATGAAQAVAGVALMASSGMAWNVTSRVARQRHVEAAVLGRVTAALRLVSLAIMPFGAVLGGLIAEAAGVRWAVAVPGGLAVVAAAIFVSIPASLFPGPVVADQPLTIAAR